MNRAAIIRITSIISVAMLCTGIGIVMIPPMVIEMLSSYSPDNEILVEAIISTLMVSTLPTLFSALLIIGLFGLGILGLLEINNR
jgi:hypothetical protein